MNAQPLKKAIYDKAKELGIEQITLHFSGGNDEGFLDIEIEPSVECISSNNDFYREIEDWAWEAYDYNGAGDGSEYGDDITYDLKNGKVSTGIWYHTRQEENEGSEELEILDEKD